MSLLRNAAADLLRAALADLPQIDLPQAATDLVAAVRDAVGDQAFTAAAPLGTVLVTVEGGIAEPTVIPAGVALRIVDIDTDTTEPDEIVHDSTTLGPVGGRATLAATDRRITDLTSA